MSKIPVRIFHAHGASITKDWKLPIKLVCKAMLPANMNEHYSCGVEAARCYFGNKVVGEKDYVLIPNAINISNFVFNELTREKIRRENGLDGKHVIGHVGRFMAQKNHMFLLDVFAEVHKLDEKAQLVLLGDGELMEAVKQKADKLNLENNITFVGNVGNANEWYQAFDCFVLPSIWEGLPVVGVEAQAADLPCVFSANVTREIGFSERAEFIGLDEPLNKWARTIGKALLQTNRVDRTDLITEKHYLVNGGKSCMAGFVLKNTLSDNGGVTRGICKMDEQSNLTEVVETKNIVKTATGAEADGMAVDVNSLVSMNMWGLTPEFLDVLEEGFKEFFEKEVPGNPLKAEYLIPIFIGELLEQGKMSVKVLKTNDTWYGMTYHEDVAAVKDSFKKMLESGVYKADLFSDL